MILINIGLALFLSLLIGYRLVYSIRPLTEGIQDIAEDRETFIEPKGILTDLAQSVNLASTLLQKKKLKFEVVGMKPVRTGLQVFHMNTRIPFQWSLDMQVI